MRDAATTATPSSARLALIVELIDRTGLDEGILSALVQEFYGRVRADAVLGPIFDAVVTDWPAHLVRLTDFWSSVALMTGRYHGRPMQKHVPLDLAPEHFERWLELFGETARDICPPAGAAHVIGKANHIALAISSAIEDGRRGNGLAGIPPRF